MNEPNKMSRVEIRSSAGLALIFFLRMLGLFLIIPVFSIYAHDLRGATPTLVGLALGAYGLTQALFQIPFGSLSDKLGRKPVIATGLMIFAAGSVLAGAGEDIITVIIGRSLQGAGAIAAAVMALAADLTHEDNRTKAMAMIGISVGLAFSLAFVIGPVLSGFMHASGLFYISAILALLAILVLYLLIPNPAQEQKQKYQMPSLQRFREVLKDPVLLHFDIGIFILHMALMANFVVIPLSLMEVTELAAAQHWRIYLPVILLSGAIIFPVIFFVEKRHMAKYIFIGAILLFGLAQFGLAISQQAFWPYTAMLVVFFTGFNYLEASLPSQVSKNVYPSDRGTALGIYSSCQFIGTFLGGVAGGFLYEHFGFTGVYLFGSIAALLWVFFAVFAPLQRTSTNNIQIGEPKN